VNTPTASFHLAAEQELVVLRWAAFEPAATQEVARTNPTLLPTDNNPKPHVVLGPDY